MSTLKSMTGTTNFMELPDNQKKCAIHNREECQTNKFLGQIKAKCSCVPWSLATNEKNTKAQVISFLELITAAAAKKFTQESVPPSGGPTTNGTSRNGIRGMEKCIRGECWHYICKMRKEEPSEEQSTTEYTNAWKQVSGRRKGFKKNE